MKASKEVIEYLDEHMQPLGTHEMVYTLFSEGAVLDAGDIDDFNVVSEWVYTTGTVEESKMRELAIIEHVFGATKLEIE